MEEQASAAARQGAETRLPGGMLLRGVMDSLALRMQRAPVLFWRMGFGPLLGRRVLILTHIGRRSGRLRRTALEYYRQGERIYVISAHPRTDWLANLLAQPRVTVQTSDGTQRAFARLLSTPADFFEFYSVIERSPLLRGLLESAGEETTLTGFLAAQLGRGEEPGPRFTIVTFDPADVPTPPALEADLRWVAPFVIAAFAAGYLLGGRRGGRPKRRPRLKF